MFLEKSWVTKYDIGLFPYLLSGFFYGETIFLNDLVLIL